MTRALVVYESLFGDTRRIAEAVAAGLAERMPVEVAEAGHAPGEIGADVGLLVVGVPTHAFSMPRQSTRESAVQQYGASVADPTTGVHEWLDAVRVTGTALRAAAFDTVVTHPKLVVKLNHATKAEEKLLRKLGASIAAPAEHFVVEDAKGPLAEGEEDRARAWGRSLAEVMAAAVRG
jgi:flavodoxin